MKTYSHIYITAADRGEAEKIASELVKSRLAACANIIDSVKSIYRWEGKICNDNESLIIAKTKSSLVPELIKLVKSIHSYSCPCIVALPINNGYPEFLDWIDRETK